MPRHCSAGGCKSRDNRETRGAGVTFHKLPKEATRRTLWISNSQRAASWDPQTDFVYFCSRHFTPESFELTGCSGIRRLKEDAFPTVFDSSTRRGTARKSEDRKNPRSSGQKKEKGPTSEDTTVQRAVTETGGSNGNVPAFPQETAEAKRPEHSSPTSCLLSPSRYMRRLPPPPGFYLPREHSYAQLCPLLWRRRYDHAIDCLEKALRQLHAARRRENRLRSAVLRLRDKRLKHTLLVSRDSSKNQRGWTPGGAHRQGRGGFNQESEATAKCEDRSDGDQMELEGSFLSDINSWSEEKGYCFYCRRGQGGVPKSGTDVCLTVDKDCVTIESRAGSSTSGNASNKQTGRLENSAGDVADAGVSNATSPQLQLQTDSFQQVIPATAPPPDAHEQASEQELLLSHLFEGQEHQQDPQQQLFWIQDDTEAQVILVPLPAEDGLQSFFKVEGDADEAQTILISELNLKQDLGMLLESGQGPSQVETASSHKPGHPHSDVSRKPAERRDVREKLKEHLEGFHLQLSAEFLQ